MPGRPEQPERGLDLAAIEPGLRARAASALVSGSVALVLALAGPAYAAPPLDLGDCGPAQGVHQCSGLVRTWDGVPLDTTVTLPVSRRALGLPLVVEIHGFGNSKHEYLDPASTAYTDNAFGWAQARLRGAHLHRARAVGLVRHARVAAGQSRRRARAATSISPTRATRCATPRS